MDEAPAIVKGLKSAVGWAFFLASVKERRAGTLEFTNRKMRFTESSKEYHIQTNHFADPAMQDSEMYVNASLVADSLARKQRVARLLAENHSRLHKTAVMSLLADPVDPLAGVTRGLKNTVCVHTTVASLVIDPDRGKIFALDALPAQIPARAPRAAPGPAPDKRHTT